MELLQVTAVWFRKVQRRCSEACVGSSEADVKINFCCCGYHRSLFFDTMTWSFLAELVYPFPYQEGFTSQNEGMMDSKTWRVLNEELFPRLKLLFEYLVRSMQWSSASEPDLRYFFGVQESI